ncbi:unnamed protein product [Symbiodinium sp. CCMP2592]|nr:unnamed protein product [Symbiodinium sp. CCMP2592]
MATEACATIVDLALVNQDPLTCCFDACANLMITAASARIVNAHSDLLPVKQHMQAPFLIAAMQQRAFAATLAGESKQNRPSVVTSVSCPRSHQHAGDTGADPTLSLPLSHAFCDGSKTAQAAMDQGLGSAGVLALASAAYSLIPYSRGGDPHASCVGRLWTEVFTSPMPCVCKVGCQYDDVVIRCGKRKMSVAPGCATWIEVFTSPVTGPLLQCVWLDACASQLRSGFEGLSSPWPPQGRVLCRAPARSAASLCYAWLRGPTSPWQPELRAIRASAELQPLIATQASSRCCGERGQTEVSARCGEMTSPALDWPGQKNCQFHVLLFHAGTLARVKGCHKRYLPDHCLLPRDPFYHEWASCVVVRAMGHSAASKRRQRARLGKRERQAETTPDDAGHDGPNATPAPEVVIHGEDSSAATSSFIATASAADPDGSWSGEVTLPSSSSSSGLRGLPLVHMSARRDEGSMLDEAEGVTDVVEETTHQPAHAQMTLEGTPTVSGTAVSSGSAGGSICTLSGSAASAVEVVSSSSDEELPTHGRKRGRPPTPPRPRPLEALAHTDEELVPTDYAGYPEQGPDEPRLHYLRRCLREALQASTHPSTDWARAKELSGQVLLCACQLSPIVLSYYFGVISLDVVTASGFPPRSVPASMCEGNGPGLSAGPPRG